MSSFLHTIANRLVPLFLTPNGTPEAAKAAATHAINAYRPETPADILRVARILALSFAAIAAAAQAEAKDLSSTQRLHYWTKTNTLSRSAAQAEAAFAKARQQPQPASAPSPATLSDDALSVLLDQAMDEFCAASIPRAQPARASAAAPGFRQGLLRTAPNRALA